MPTQYIPAPAPQETYTAPVDPNVGNATGTESSLSNWAGDYVTDMLGRGWALADQPYQPYTGQLTAGPSDLQTQAFSGIAGLTLPSGFWDSKTMNWDVYDKAGQAGQYDALNQNPANFTPTGIGTQSWDNEQAARYMNPYLQQALEPQLAEIARQSQIQRLKDNSALTKAGAYGGSRQAIMNSEQNDNMMRLMAELTGKGYMDAYNTAGSMFGSDQDRRLKADMASEQSRQFGADLGLQGSKLQEQSRQYGAGLGLDALRTQLDSAKQAGNLGSMELQGLRDIYGDQIDAGNIQRGITSEGINADIAQFEHERDYPYRQVQYMQSLLDGLPLSAQNTTYAQPSGVSNFLSSAGGISQLYDLLFG